ncbi:TPA: hypothetical protein QDB51_002632 [Burkholderia vietnamiensis]|uniref:hypothetical protein n=1 Tax=Burkholderia multivorans TaxID=87883 RepID=UPI0011B20B89|nr:hypothetical protein [Burkholderia multivorans]HDR9188557.1 hypothetical protein [Burkholderia vietnamiensis]
MKYEIDLEAVLPLISTVIIEADSDEEAEAIAIEMAKRPGFFWIHCTYDCIRNFEAVEISSYDGDDEADNTEGDEDE